MDVGINPQPYGTHSFRRGGAQFLKHVKRKDIIDICEYGGWSKDNEDFSIIFKYLLSWNDAKRNSRKDFLNPRPQLGDRCPACLRDCLCAGSGI